MSATCIDIERDPNGKWDAFWGRYNCKKWEISGQEYEEERRTKECKKAECDGRITQ